MGTSAAARDHLSVDRTSSALIVIDFQRDLTDVGNHTIPGTTEVAPAVRRPVQTFRRAARPIVRAVRLNPPGSSGDAISVVNVGAGAGSYEPSDRKVTAVEPSAAMRASWRLADPASTHAALSRLADALAEGEWDQRLGALRSQPTFHGSLRLFTAWPEAR